MLKTILALILMITPALARDYCTGSPSAADLPANLKVPTVNIDVHIIPRSKVFAYCGAGHKTVTACSYPDPNDAGTWIVLVSNDVPAGPQFECVMRYEQAHMPPNYWGDPKVELPDTIKWLAKQH